MKTYIKEILFAVFAFTISFSLAYITQIEIVKNAVEIEKRPQLS